MSSTPTGLAWDTNMAADLMFQDTLMADVKSCEKPLHDSAREYIFRW